MSDLKPFKMSHDNDHGSNRDDDSDDDNDNDEKIRRVMRLMNVMSIKRLVGKLVFKKQL